MSIYTIILFVHVSAVLAMFGALTLEIQSVFRLRRASTLAEVRLWIDPIPGLPALAMGSLLVVVVSGIYLTSRMAAFGESWPKVTIGALFLVAPIAAATGRRMRAIRGMSLAGVAIPTELRHRLQDRVLTVSLGVRTAVMFGIVLLMGAKPELRESLGIVGASFASGVMAPLLVLRRTG